MTTAASRRRPGTLAWLPSWLTVLAGNSPNHGRRGQNVLFSDGSLRWFPGRRVSPVDDDLYLNNRAKPEPGVNLFDAALVPAVFRVKAP